MKYTTKTCYVVDYNDLEKAVEALAEREYSYVADVECGNDSAKTYRVEKCELDEYEQESIAEFVETGVHCNIAYAVLQHFVNIGALPAGDIVVEVSW